jgi:hypothetical protein
MVAVIGELIVPTLSVPNASVAGVNVTGAIPVPVRLIVCGLLLALSLIETVPGTLPAFEGVNVTVILQLAPVAMLVPQVFVWL